MRTHMVADLGEMHINEQRLFHGTSSEVIPAICKEGFDWRMFGRNGSAFGQGTYFARDANYSHTYSAKHGPYKISSGFGAHSALNRLILARMMPPANRSSGHGAFTFGGPPPAHSGGTTVIISAPSTTNTTQQQGFNSGFSFGQPNSSAGTQQQSSGFTLGAPVPTNAAHQQTSGFQFGNSAVPNSAGHQQTSGFQFGNSTVLNSAGHQQTSGFQFGNSNSGAGSQQQPGFSSVFGFGGHPFPSSQTGGSNVGSGFNFGSNSNQRSGIFGSDDIMDNSSGNFMFVGRVLVGRICKGTPDMRRPPKDESDPQKRLCHTAVNHTHKPSIFVVFESAQCYPEYLIEYKNAV